MFEAKAKALPEAAVAAASAATVMVPLLTKLTPALPAVAEAFCTNAEVIDAVAVAGPTPVSLAAAFAVIEIAALLVKLMNASGPVVVTAAARDRPPVAV